MQFLKNVCANSRRLFAFPQAQTVGLCLLLLSVLYHVKKVIDVQIQYQHRLHLFCTDFPKDSEFKDDFTMHFDTLVDDKLLIEVLSSKNSVKVAVDGDILYDSSSSQSGRGIHIIVLNQTTGALRFSRHFDTYSHGEETRLSNFLDEIGSREQLIVFAVKDEASFSLTDYGRKKFMRMGSNLIAGLSWRSMWAMVTIDGKALAEDISNVKNLSSWPDEVHLSVNFEPRASRATSHCDWTGLADRQQRKDFCSKFEHHRDVCSCESPLVLPKPSPLADNLVYDVPVIVIASNRPYYLKRMLQSLLAADGVNVEKIVVFIDGHFEEAMELTRLFGVRGMYHTPAGVGNARISQHYLSSLSATFALFPQAENCIVFEEDLDVSPDIFRYFSRTLSLLNSDPSIYCVSAWNDQGYEHSSGDPGLLYRVETMPGLGWMLRRSLFEDELKPHWPGPDKQWDWDMWMRHPGIRKGRECVIPDVSRTFHFGKTGVNMNNNFYDMYFASKSFNKDRDVTLQDVEMLRKENYERVVHKLVRESALLNHSKTPCDADFVPFTMSSPLNVAYFSMTNERQFDNFIQICKCLKIWDLDARGLHKSSFRTFIKTHHVIFVGYPTSPYAIYKPVNVKPIAFD